MGMYDPFWEVMESLHGRLAVYEQIGREIASFSGTAASSLSAIDRAEKIADLVKGGMAIEAATSTVDSQGGTTLLDLTRQRDAVAKEIFDAGTGLLARAFRMDPERVIADSRVASYLSRDMVEDLFGPTGPAGPAARSASYQFMFGPGGEAVALGSDGNIRRLGTFPELAERDIQMQIHPRTGDLIAIDAADPSKPPVVVQERFGFAEIDPQVVHEEGIRQFEQTLRVRQAEAAAAFEGIELQRRGQIIAAIGEDFANQVEVGGMRYDESILNLNRIESAISARREARAELLKFAVAESSLRTSSTGQTVTRLPFAEQTAAILGQATGQDISAEQFDLPVVYGNPEQEAQDVMQASSFESPIPGLVQQFQGARDAINQVVSAPVGNAALSEQLTRAAGG